MFSVCGLWCDKTLHTYMPKHIKYFHAVCLVCGCVCTGGGGGGAERVGTRTARKHAHIQRKYIRKYIAHLSSEVMKAQSVKILLKKNQKSRSTPVIGRHIWKALRLPGLGLISTIHASVCAELGFS